MLVSSVPNYCPEILFIGWLLPIKGWNVRECKKWRKQWQDALIINAWRESNSLCLVFCFSRLRFDKCNVCVMHGLQEQSRGRWQKKTPRPKPWPSMPPAAHCSHPAAAPTPAEPRGWGVPPALCSWSSWLLTFVFSQPVVFPPSFPLLSAIKCASRCSEVTSCF